MQLTKAAILPARQRNFSLDDPRFRPLVNANAAMAMLDRTALEIDALCDEARLIAFDIRAVGERKELRILASSIARLQTGQTPLVPLDDWPEIFTRICGPQKNKPALTGVDVQRSLNCDSGHVINLLNEKLLRVVPGTDWQRGPGGSPSIVTSSFEQFLKGRLQ